MKKLSYLIVLILILGLALTGCTFLSNIGQAPATEQKYNEDNPNLNVFEAQDLVAGQNTKVGTVTVWNDAQYLYITYLIDEPDWYLTETHLAVATLCSEIPQKKGNPTPGHFPYSTEHDPAVKEWTYEIPLDWECGTTLCIAAHAALLNLDNIIGYVLDPDTGDPLEPLQPIFQEETGWGYGEEFEGDNWATHFPYEIICIEIEEVWPEGGTISVAFEDLLLSEVNDWDYNDWVADIDTHATFWGTSESHDYLTEMQFTIRPEAKIAGYTHVMHLAARSFGCDGNYELYRDGVDAGAGYYDDDAGFDVVLVPDTETPPLEVVLTISFEPGCTFEFPVWEENLYHGENLFFDPWLYVKNNQEQVHTGDVRMLTVPVDWAWPIPDRTPIWTVYEKVGETTDPLSGPVFCPEWWIIIP